MAESGQPAQGGAPAGAASFDALGEGKGDSALPEARKDDPGLDPRWPPVKRATGEGGEAVVIVIESSEVMTTTPAQQPAPAAGAPAGALTEEEVKKHNTKDDCWVRRPFAHCALRTAHCAIYRC
jgi:hypothetical protein